MDDADPVKRKANTNRERVEAFLARKVEEAKSGAPAEAQTLKVVPKKPVTDMAAMLKVSIAAAKNRSAKVAA
jgi:hypothetical protein